MESLAALRFLKKRPQEKGTRGFTLVEMMVVLTIIVLISGIVINGQSAYNQSIILTDTAYSLAFSIRQAQSFGLASRGRLVNGNVYSNVGYGVRFVEGSNYLIFADVAGPALVHEAYCPQGTANTPDQKRGNCRYDGTSTDQIVENFTFNRGFTISEVCGKYPNGLYNCWITSLDVVFRRPETGAVLSGTELEMFTCAEIHVRAPAGTATRIVRVSQLGEVSVGQPCP